jgi:hypothetical protein
VCSQSARFSAESEGSTSALNGQVCAFCGSVSQTPTAEPCCESTGRRSRATKTSAYWPTPRAGATSDRVSYPGYRFSLEAAMAQGWSPSIFSAGDSHASLSASQEPAGATQTNAGSGQSLLDSFAYFDPATRSWRTSQGSLLEEAWPRYLETWPRAGTTRSGTAYRRLPSVPHTSVTGSLSLPTPSALNGLNGGSNVRASHPELWPTPHGFSKDGRSNGPSGNELGWAVNQRMLPTPQASDYKGPNLTDPSSGSGHGLAMVAGGSLNPMWVEWLMGFPLGWTVLEPSEMPLSRKSRKRSAGPSSPHITEKPHDT